MSPNPERMRALLRNLDKKDPDAGVRQQLISGRPLDNPARAHAIILLSSYLLRDPYELVTGAPPPWLVELSRGTPTGVTMLFDNRLTELARTAVDDLLSRGCDVDQLIDWLDDMPGSESRNSALFG